METEASNVSDRTNPLSLPFGAVRLSGIFNNGKAASTGDFHDAVHIGGIAAVVNDFYRLCAGGDGRFHRISRNLICVRFDIDENRDSACENDSRGGSDEGYRRNDNFISRFDAAGT